MLLPDNKAAGLSAVEFSLVSVEVATGPNHCVHGINWLEKFLNATAPSTVREAEELQAQQHDAFMCTHLFVPIHMCSINMRFPSD